MRYERPIPGRLSDRQAARRRLLLAALGLGFLSACGGRREGGQRIEAVEFDASTTCVLDGLRLIDYPGPKAQIHFAGREHPDFFCDTVEMFHVHLNTRDRDSIRALFVQDIGAGGWRPATGHWIDARHAWYVGGSKRLGPMGPTLASFSAAADAERFAAEYGGEVLRFNDIDADRVILDGGALHDTRM